MDFKLIAGTVVCWGLAAAVAVPLLYALYKFLCELRIQVKEAQSELYEFVDDKRAGYFGVYLQSELDRQREIAETGLAAYRDGKKKAFQKKYGILLYAAGILLVLAVVLFPSVLAAAERLAVRFHVAENFSYACFALSLILVLYYLCCKTHQRKKWKASFVIAGIAGLHFICRLADLPITPVPVEVLSPVFLVLGLYHYRKWRKGLDEMTEILQYRLQEKRYADDTAVQQYLALQQQRKANGYRLSLEEHDNELDEMMLYLSWLEQAKAE
ncbi:MAG: hypothetical protein IKU46_00895 [Peptococcaceae bacterium]|nr:hypothetical protein [Peptococcaceae bacterium]